MKILSVGRIAPTKNYEVLIEAINILQQRGVDVQVTIVGEPALPQDVEYGKKIQRASDGLHVNFVGKKTHSELPNIYRSHDLFVHMSQTGSLDRVLLEAMSCGIRVLSCNDAARAFLPNELIFENAEDLANKIQNHTIHFDGRAYVLEHHDLKKLISRISALL